MPDDDYETVDSSHRYVLGAGDDYYGIWDKLGAREPVHRFPGTDEGLTQAEERFWALSRDDDKERDVWSTRLRWALFIALGVWVVAGALGTVFVLNLIPTFGESISDFDRITFVVQDVAFRVWVASLVALIALGLKRHFPRSTGRASLPPR